ncbi:hypothetical protein [Acinetobacter sp.]|uniref:hypothetical protein n=1 Tax=Acinetobacter sp. TaxID=472 RepID=UPI003CFFA790
MGKPVWVMLKKIPDWRWLSDGEPTPWYPSARIYRQANHGDWMSVMRRLAKDLLKLTSNHSKLIDKNHCC